MSESIFKQYQHGCSSYAERITAEDWNQHRPLVTGLHNQHATKKEILAKLNQCDFHPSMGQLVAQMKKWNLTVYGQYNRDAAKKTRAIGPNSYSSNGLDQSDSTTPVAAVKSSDDPFADQTPGEPSSNEVDRSSLNAHTMALKDDALTLHEEQLLARLQISTRSMYHSSSGHNVDRCCCAEFFAGKGIFSQATAYYIACLRRSEKQRNLNFAWLLESCFQFRIDHFGLSSLNVFEQTLQYYMQLINDANITVPALPSYLLELLQIDESIATNPSKFTPTATTLHKFAQYDLPLFTSGKSKIRLGASGIVQYLPANKDSPNLRDMKVEFVNGILSQCRLAIQSENESIVALLRGNDFLSTVLYDGLTFHGATTIIKLGQRIADHLEHSCTIAAFPVRDLGTFGCSQARVLFDAIALWYVCQMKSLLKLESTSDLYNAHAAAKHVVKAAMHKLHLEDIAEASASPDLTIQELRRFTWICDINTTTTTNFDPEELHYGLCLYNNVWQDLEKDICHYDQNRNSTDVNHFPGAVIEPQPQQQRQQQQEQILSIQQPLTNTSVEINSVAGDAMTLMTTSTDSSVRRFRAFAQTLKSRRLSSAAPPVSSIFSERVSLNGVGDWLIATPDDETDPTDAGKRATSLRFSPTDLSFMMPTDHQAFNAWNEAGSVGGRSMSSKPTR